MWSKLLDRSPDAEVKSGFQNTTKAQQASKSTKLNTAKLSTTSHRESFEQEMESALAQWEEKESSTPDEKWAALQQVVYNTAKTCPDRKYQDWFDPNDQELQTLMSRRDQAHQRVLQTRSTRSTTAAYKDAYRLLQKRTHALKSLYFITLHTSTCDLVSGLKQGIRPNPLLRMIKNDPFAQISKLYPVDPAIYIKDKLSPATPRDNKSQDELTKCGPSSQLPPTFITPVSINEPLQSTVHGLLPTTWL